MVNSLGLVSDVVDPASLFVAVAERHEDIKSIINPSLHISMRDYNFPRIADAVNLRGNYFARSHFRLLDHFKDLAGEEHKLFIFRVSCPTKFGVFATSFAFLIF